MISDFILKTFVPREQRAAKSPQRNLLCVTPPSLCPAAGSFYCTFTGHTRTPHTHTGRPWVCVALTGVSQLGSRLQIRAADKTHTHTHSAAVMDHSSSCSPEDQHIPDNDLKLLFWKVLFPLILSVYLSNRLMLMNPFPLCNSFSSLTNPCLYIRPPSGHFIPNPPLKHLQTNQPLNQTSC